MTKVTLKVIFLMQSVHNHQLKDKEFFFFFTVLLYGFCKRHTGYKKAPKKVKNENL